MSEETIEYNNMFLTVEEWSYLYDLPVNLIKRRLANDWDIESALTSPKERGFAKMFSYNGMHKTLKEWAEYLKVSEDTLRWRVLEYTKEEDKNKIFTVGRVKTYHGPMAKTYYYDGENFTVSELSKKYNISTSNIRSRLARGYTLDEALTEGNINTINANKYMINGEEITLRELSEKTGLRKNTIRARLRYGWNIDDIGKELQEGGITHSKKYMYKGEMKTAKEIAEDKSVTIECIKNRVRRGIPLEADRLRAKAKRKK